MFVFKHDREIESQQIEMAGEEELLYVLPVSEISLLDHLPEAVAECRKHTSSTKAFLKRMYDHFDAFFIVKFLNTFGKDSAYPPMNVLDATSLLLN